VSTVYDLVVVGSGAAGLATAVTAAHLGLRVAVVEKDRQFGGTSAWSGGWLWVPRNPLAVEAGIIEDIEAPLTYLRSELGNGFDEGLCRRFLEQAPRMVGFFRAHTALDFIDGNVIPDFHESEGWRNGGRSVSAMPFDGRALGRRLGDLKPPLDLVAPFGMGIASGADLRHFLNATRKPASFLHVARRMVRHMAERLLHGRGLTLVNGNALIARLLKSADDLGVALIHSAPVTRLMVEQGRVTGIEAARDGEPLVLGARKAVVLASGGFPHDAARQARLFPHVAGGGAHHSAAPLSNTGDGMRLGEAAGGMVRGDLPNAGAWAPVSLVPQGDGTFGRFPHLIERAKPGLIMVRKDGRRFANEANSYHDLMQDLFAATPAGEPVECWMICDHAFQRRYGLGRARPRPFPIRPWLRNGYLIKGYTLAQLAGQCGIDAAGLEATVATYNAAAERGEDPAFHRGNTAYNRIQGDAEHGPNPALGPVGEGPYYAVRIVPGSLGTFAGLVTDKDTRVLDAAGAQVPGLHAVGNDMSSMMAGRYPSGGITLGPGMTFGYIAAHVIAGKPLERD
jgi:succinate dehydrogenase/fumarate reductase flavoprotein subunit